MNPLDLLKYNRFDVCAKLLYIDFYLKNYKSKWGEEVYLSHLKVWNNFKEGSDLSKNGPDIFMDRFNSIINSMSDDGFNKAHPIVLNFANLLMNGSHRLSSAIYHKLDVPYEILDESHGHGQSACSYNYFRNKKNFVSTGLEPKYMDAMAKEYCKYKKNAFLLFLFDDDASNLGKVESIISQKSNIVYKKDIALSKNGAINLIWHIYYGEPWLGQPERGNMSAACVKFDLAFKEKSLAEMKIYLIEVEGEDPQGVVVDLKNHIRSVCKGGRHSCHINDTHKETTFLADIVFNDNSLFAIDHYKYNKDFDMFNKLFLRVKASSTDRNDFCIVSSSLLGLFGVRDVKDIDYISRGDVPLLADVAGTGNHLSEKHYYGQSFDDIIYNPTNHFHFNGVKFCTLDVLRTMKQKRNEEKDIKDIELIKGLV